MPLEYEGSGIKETMRCQCCEQHKATVQIRDVENWAVKDVILICDACSKLIATQFIMPHIPMPVTREALEKAKEAMGKSGVAGVAPVGDEAEAAPDITCKNCGMSFKEFQKAGRLGCAECYKAFNETLEPILERIHGSQPAQHTGRKPGAPKADSRASVRQRVQTLKRQMDAAVKEENYERAAKLRDEINGLETGMKE